MKTNKLLFKILFPVLLVVLIVTAFGLQASTTKTTYAADVNPKLTVKYIDEDGKSLALDEVITTKNGGQYTLGIKTITGYAFKSSSIPVVGTIYEDTTLYMTYKENKLKLTVKFEDEEGNTLKNAKVYSTTLRTLLTLDLREIGVIEGYTYTGNSQIIDVEIVGNATLTLCNRYYCKSLYQTNKGR